MRILRAYLRLPPWPGGMERHIALLSACQRDAGHTVDVVFNQGQPTADTDLQVLPRWDLSHLRPQALAVLLFSLAACWAVGLRRRRYDVVHVHGDWSALLLARLLRRLAGAPVLAFTIHGGLQPRWIHRRLLPWLLRRTHVAFSTGHCAAQVLTKASGRLVQARSSGVLELFFTTPASAGPGLDAVLQVLTVARLSPKKNLGLVLDIAAQMPEAEFRIVGDGPQRAALQARIQSEGLVNAKLLGARPAGEVCHLMDQAHCFLLTSHEEGTPTAALEALVRGLPVVVSPAGGIAAIVQEGVNGHVVDSPHAPEPYVRCLRGLESAPVRRRMGQANRELGQRFRWPAVAAELSAAMALALPQCAGQEGHTRSGPIRVLLVTNGLGLGGAERVMLQTAQALAERGCTFVLLNIDPRRQELAGEARRLDLPMLSVPFAAAWLPTTLWRCLRWLRAQRVELIHAHLPLAGVYARLLGHLAGCPVIYTEHNLVTKYRRATHWLNRLTYGWNARSIAVSHAVHDCILATYGQQHAARCVVIPNGVDSADIQTAAAQGPDARTELGLSPQARVIGTVASFRPVKRLDLLLRAFARLAPDEPQARLLLVGYGAIQGELERLAVGLGVRDRVLFTGLRHDALRLMRCMDVFVICSDWEGLPMALLEAMALARPIVATRVGGIPEVVEDGRSGRLVAPDDEAALRQALADMLAAPDAAAALGRGAREAVARQRGLQEMATAILNVYTLVAQAEG